MVNVDRRVERERGGPGITMWTTSSTGQNSGEAHHPASRMLSLISLGRMPGRVGGARRMLNPWTRGQSKLRGTLPRLTVWVQAFIQQVQLSP